MRLYLVQRGEAKTEEDPERPLTDRGASDVRLVARVAGEPGAITAERILRSESDKTQARETAETSGAALGVPVDEAEGLAPRDDPSTWVKCRHAAGDTYLRAMADALRRVLRASDTADGVGGDEFVVFLPETAGGGTGHRRSSAGGRRATVRVGRCHVLRRHRRPTSVRHP